MIKKQKICLLIGLCVISILATNSANSPSLRSISLLDAPKPSILYTWGADRNMTLTTGADWTKSVVEDSGDVLEVESLKTDTISNVSIYDGTDHLIVDSNTGNSSDLQLTRLYNPESGLEVFYESSFWYGHTLNLSTVDMDMNYEVYRDTSTNELRDFECNIGDIMIDYWSTASRPLLITDDKSSASDEIFLELAYNETRNEFKWVDASGSLGFELFTVNSSGVWNTTDQVIDWATLTPQEYDFGISMLEDDFVNMTCNDATIVFSYHEKSVLLYELIFSKLPGGNITLSLISHFPDYPLILDWIGDAITMRYGDAIDFFTLTQNIGIIENKMYDFSYELYDLEITHYKQRGEIEWSWISVEVVKYVVLFDWIVLFNWHTFSWNVQWSSAVGSQEFFYYSVLMEYYYIKQEIYFYEVPTIVLPNRLVITLEEAIYSDEQFTFTFLVTDFRGKPVGNGIMTGTWNGSDISFIADYTGRYSTSVDPILVSPGDEGIPLSVEIYKTGYSNGTLTMLIGVDPEVVDKSTSNGKNNGPNDLLWIVVGFIAVIGVIALVVTFKFKSR